MIELIFYEDCVMLLASIFYDAFVDLMSCLLN